MAIDGKMLRRSFDWATGKGAIHMVGAGAAANCLISGQRKVEEKSNEIKAISALSEQLDLEGFLVMIDATGCQKEVARTIMEQRADYVLALKGNQGALHGEVQIFFTWAISTSLPRFPSLLLHGRWEPRTPGGATVLASVRDWMVSGGCGMAGLAQLWHDGSHTARWVRTRPSSGVII